LDEARFVEVFVAGDNLLLIDEIGCEAREDGGSGDDHGLRLHSFEGHVPGEGFLSEVHASEGESSSP